MYVNGASKYDRLIQTPKKATVLFFFANAYEYQMNILNCFLQHKKHKQVQKTVSVLLVLCLLSWSDFQRNTRWDFQNSADLRQQKKPGTFWSEEFLVENLLLRRLDFLGLKGSQKTGCWEMNKSSEWFERLNHAHPFSCEDTYIHIILYA